MMPKYWILYRQYAKIKNNHFQTNVSSSETIWNKDPFVITKFMRKKIDVLYINRNNINRNNVENICAAISYYLLFAEVLQIDINGWK